MYDSLVGILCDGDFPGRNTARKFFTVEDMEFLHQEKEKATAPTVTFSKAVND